MGDRFYGQRDGKLGYKATRHEVAKKPRRLKADIVKDIELLVGKIPSLDRMTVEGLNTLLESIEVICERA